MKLSANAAGARALLRCVATDMRWPALSMLGKPGLPEALREIAAEALPMLTVALRGIAADAADATARRIDMLRDELNLLRKLIAQAATPEWKALAAEADAVAAQLLVRQVPHFLETALTSKYHRDVKEALAALERVGSPESRAALEKFRSTKSRLVEKTVPGGIGADKESYVMHCYTSEFGQPKSDEEIAHDRRLLEDYEKRQAARKPKPTAPPPVAAPPPPPPAEPGAGEPEELSNDFVAASQCGIQADLLRLVDAQIKLLLTLHERGSLAPLAAFMNPKGEIEGLVMGAPRPGQQSLTVEGTIDFFQRHFRSEAPTGRIVASAIFYHGCHGPGRGYPQVAPAQTVDTADCIVGRLDHDSGQAVTLVIQYRVNADGSWHYDLPYYAMRTPDIFLDREYRPLLPDRLGEPRLPRRLARRSDQGTHSELMMLLECQLGALRGLLQSNQLEPVGATLSPHGEIQSVMLVSREDWEKHRMETKPKDPVVVYPVEQAGQPPIISAQFMARLFRMAGARGEIVASAIFFHGIYTTREAAQRGIMPAGIGEEPNCLVALLDHRLSQSRSVVLRYARDERGQWQFAPPEHYSAFPSVFHEDDSSYFDPPGGSS
jgi:hypothetical protein